VRENHSHIQLAALAYAPLLKDKTFFLRNFWMTFKRKKRAI